MTRKRRKVAARKAAAKRAAWFVYLLECCDGSLYTGISNDVQARLVAHQAGTGAKYTRAHLPVTLRYVEKCGTKGRALRKEWEVKKLTRGKKLELVSQES